MALNNLGLGILLEAKDEFSEVMERAKHKFGETDKAATGLVTHFGWATKALALGAAAVAAAGVTVGVAWHFASEASKGSLLIAQAGARAGASAEQLEELARAADEVGLAGIGVSADEAAEQLKVLIANGMGVEGALGTLRASIALTKASLGEMAGPQAAQAVASILKEFHLRAEDATEVVDKLAMAMRLFGVTSTDLVPMVTGVARGAELAGASFEDALAAVGLAKKVLPDAGQAVMGVNMALGSLAGGKAREKLAGLGVQARDSSGQMKPLLTILAELDERLGSMSEGDKAANIGAVFGPRGAGTMVAIMGELARGVRTASGEMVHGAAAAAELTRQMAESNGAAADMSRTVGGEMASQVKRLHKNLEMFSDLVGGPFTKVFAPALALISEGIKRINRSVADGEGFWGSLAQAMGSVALAFNGLLQLFTQGGFSGKVREEMAKAENGGVKYFAVQVWHWLGVLGELWDGFVAGWDATMSGLQPVFDALWHALKGLGDALGITSATADENATVWDTLGDLGTKIGTAVAFAASVITGAFVVGMELATVAIEEFKGAWRLLWPVVRPIAMNIADTIAFIAALLNADLSQAWRRMAAVGLDSVRLVVGSLSSLLILMGKAIDWFGRIFALKEWGVADMMGGQLEGILGRMDRFREELVTGVTPNVIPMQTQAALPTTADELGLMSARAPQSIEPAMALAIMQGNQLAAADSAASSLQSMMSGPAPGGEQRIIVPVSIDGEKVGEAVAKVKRRQDGRAFRPGRLAGQEG